MDNVPALNVRTFAMRCMKLMQKCIYLELSRDQSQMSDIIPAAYGDQHVMAWIA